MKVTSITPTDGIKISHRKEKYFEKQLTLVAIYKGNLIELATLRIYHTSVMAYACIWVHDKVHNIYCTGSGSAEGGGYHKAPRTNFPRAKFIGASASMEGALYKAGIRLSESISGRGEKIMEESLIALGKKLGFKKVYTLSAHA